MQANTKKLPTEDLRNDSQRDLEPRDTPIEGSTKILSTAISLTAVFGMLYFMHLFWRGISKYWFNPAVTTDDALQQSYIFHKIKYPNIFEGDLITQAMESYLAPVHYWISYLATALSGSPIMGGHWVMLVQLLVTVLCIFFAVYKIGGLAPACFSVTWLLHSRHIVQRMTGGLPRGWAGPILTATICFALYGNHYAVLAVLFIGCLSNPPSTMIAALFYGFVLCARSLWEEPVKRLKARGQLKQYLLLSPVYLATTFYVTRPPDFIGKMASYAEAALNPAFSRPGGRFPFVPLLPAIEEIRNEGLFAFISLYERIDQARIDIIPATVIGICLALLLYAVVRRKKLLPMEIPLFLFAVATIYFAARQIPFYLYVPDRHLRLPLGFFFMIALPSALWLSAVGGKATKRGLLVGVFLLSSLGGVIYCGSGIGLRGNLNFNTRIDRKGPLFTWLNKNSKEDALIAGHPSHVDDTMLLAVRRAYITAETAHPFFDVYYREVERRLRIVWQAYYSRDLNEFYALLEGEGIDFFVFRRNDFRRHMLAKAYYFQPLTAWVAQLASHPPAEYAFSKFPAPTPGLPSKILPFRDRHSIVVNVAELGLHLAGQENDSQAPVDAPELN